ncbi:hypothetical protein [Clostridium ihumii]|uniref:hypothetical protein n=1 Tax=Clostridium ihumii TaxID=1470356 RepID=UPI000557A6A7|nr:hypothetical protein [Clostridium ihumii]
MAKTLKITTCNSKVKTSPTKIGTSSPFSLVAETLVLAVFDMDTKFKIIPCNYKVETSPTLPIDS